MFKAIMVNSFLQKLQTSLDQLGVDKKQLCPVAVSGGADSLSLAIGMSVLGYQVIACTVDHSLRASSAAEASLVCEIMARFGIVYKKRVWIHNNKIAGNIENAARVARYALLAEMCRDIGCYQIYLAHHADDQMETFLLNLLRGSGLNGLCAMPSQCQMGDLIILRPLLYFTKKEIMSFLAEKGVTWIEDPTNLDTGIKRNHLRFLLSQIEDMSVIRTRVIAAIKRLQSVKLVLDRVHRHNFEQFVQMQEDALRVQISDYTALLEEERLTLLSDIIVKHSGSKYRGRINSLLRIDRGIISGTFKKCTLMNCVIVIENGYIIVRKEVKHRNTISNNTSGNTCNL